MSEEESTLNLQALQDEVKRLGVQTPWRLTFSYGRALQSATLKVRTLSVMGPFHRRYPLVQADVQLHAWSAVKGDSIHVDAFDPVNAKSNLEGAFPPFVPHI